MTESLPPLKAILFDMDGLFADTEPLQKHAFEMVCQRYAGADFRISDELHATFVGKSDEENARTVIDQFRIDVDPDRMIAERADIYVEILNTTRVVPMDGVREVMDAARASGILLAVGSSSMKRFVDPSLAGAFKTMAYPLTPAEVFGSIVAGDDPRISARKPAPDIYLQCAADLGVKPTECLALEDSASGIESARRAGIDRAYAVPNEFTVGHDFSLARHVLNSVRDVLTLGVF